MTGEDVLRAATSVLVVDWPTRDVPDTLARAGYAVVVAGGPEPDNFSAYEVSDGEVVVRHVGRPPDRADLVYSHRPVEELPEIVAAAQHAGATAVWMQTGSPEARAIVEGARLVYVDEPYIADAVRRLRIEG